MSKAKIVFWNINKKAENIALILQYAKENDVDIIALCEASLDYQDDIYQAYQGMGYEHNGILLFARKPVNVFCASEGQRYTVYRMQEPLRCTFAVVHLNSDLSKNADRYRDADIQSIKEALLIQEQKYSDKSSFVIGDFNENLFDDHLTSWSGFNVRCFMCLMGSKGTEKKHESEMDLFFSPLLQIYKDNDRENTGKGTYFFENDPVGWLCYDQVLMKKQVMKMYKPNSIQLIHELSPTISLVEKHKPKKEYSDHLPIVFELDNEEEQHE